MKIENGIENYYMVICQQCNKEFELHHLDNTDDYYAKYEEDYCPSCRFDKLAKEGIQKFSFLRNAIITGYSLEDISETPELRYIEIKLINNTFLKINVKNTRFLTIPPHQMPSDTPTQ